MKPKIVCVATNLKEALAAKKYGADLVELRIDLIKNKLINNPGFLKSTVKKIKKSTGLPLICTIRSKGEGGKYTGNNLNKLNMFNAVAPFCDYIDIELDFPFLLKGKLINKAIISKHFFNLTPSFGTISKTIRHALNFKPKIVKIAFPARNLKDLLMAVKIQNKYSKHPIALITMGKQGNIGRLLMPILGTKLTYGFAGKTVAPGQIHIKELSKIKPLI